jgi:hypothetical protein
MRQSNVVSVYNETGKDDGEISFRLDAALIVLIDPLALDGLKGILNSDFAARLAADPRGILELPGFLRAGVHRVEPFTPGNYRISRRGVERIDGVDSESDFSIFDVDTGSLVLVDVHHLAAVAQALTWERYDWALQSPLDDTSRWKEIARDAGGGVFGILRGDYDSPFPGDGRYRLRPDAFAPVRE